MMINDNTTILISVISASSAIVGIVFTQVISAWNNQKSDDRKFNSEIVKIKLLRKIEVGESFFNLCGESLQTQRAFINYLKSKMVVNSDITDSFLDDSNKKNQADFQKILDENPLASLVNLYYNVNTTFDISSQSNTKTNNHFINIIEVNSQIRKTDDEDHRQKLIEKVTIEYNALCDHFENIIEQTKNDMAIVKNEINQAHSII